METKIDNYLELRGRQMYSYHVKRRTLFFKKMHMLQIFENVYDSHVIDVADK